MAFFNPEESTAPAAAPALCGSRPALADRPLIAPEQSWRLARTFKVLANDTRLRLLHQLVLAPGACVSELAAAVDMRPQAVSNQLQRLVDQGVLVQRREGTHIHYRVADPCVTALLDLCLCLTEEVDRRRRAGPEGAGVA